MTQRRELTSKPLPDNKTQEDKINEEDHLFNEVNQGDVRLGAGRFLPPKSHCQIPPKWPRGATVPTLYEKNHVPLEDPEGHPIQPGKILTQSRTILYKAIPSMWNKLRRPVCWILLSLYSIFYFRFTKLEEFQPFIQGEFLENGRSYHLYFCHSFFQLGRHRGSL